MVASGPSRFCTSVRYSRMKGSSFRRAGRTLTLWPSYSVSVILTPVPAEGEAPPANGVGSATAPVAGGIGNGVGSRWIDTVPHFQDMHARWKLLRQAAWITGELCMHLR